MLSRILQTAAAQGRPTDQWNAFKRHVSIRVPRILPERCFLSVKPWAWREYLPGRKVA